jgi:hypothetical protein
MSVLIVNQGRVAGFSVSHDDPNFGQYLRRYDPDYQDGLGRAWWTSSRDKAKRFADVGAAMEAWRQISSIQPFRLDGRPNRPLTAYSITFEDIQP